MSDSDNLSKRMVEGYNQMLERLHQTMDLARETAKEQTPVLQNRLNEAMEKASELGELSREEALRIGDYLRRDLHDAAEFIDRNGSELKDWLQFDLEVVEQELAGRFNDMVDHTRLELEKLRLTANLVGEWHTGEITAIGTLECKGCGEKLHFHTTGRIPPCPKCRGTKYRRLFSDD